MATKYIGQRWRLAWGDIESATVTIKYVADGGAAVTIVSGAPNQSLEKGFYDWVIDAPKCAALVVTIYDDDDNDYNVSHDAVAVISITEHMWGVHPGNLKMISSYSSGTFPVIAGTYPGVVATLQNMTAGLGFDAAKQSIVFDGTNDRVHTTARPTWGPGNGIEMWIKVAQVASYRALISQYVANGNFMELFLRNNHVVDFQFTQDGVTRQVRSTDTPANGDHHICVFVDAVAPYPLRMFIDGAEATYGAQTNWGADDLSIPADLYIGAEPIAYGEYWNSEIYSFARYDCMDTDLITARYALGKTMGMSSYRNADGTGTFQYLVNAPEVIRRKKSISLTGHGFGASGATVGIGNGYEDYDAVTVTSQTENLIECTVPEDAAYGEQSIKITNSVSETAFDTVLVKPQILNSSLHCGVMVSV